MESSLIALTADYISITDMSLWWCTWVVLCWCVGHARPAPVHYTPHTCTPRPQEVNGHLRPPYTGPISLDTAHIFLGTIWGQEPKKGQ